MSASSLRPVLVLASPLIALFLSACESRPLPQGTGSPRGPVPLPRPTAAPARSGSLASPGVVPSPASRVTSAVPRPAPRPLALAQARPAGSPAAVRESPPVGGLDSVQLPAAIVNGWAYDADAPGRPVQVLISLGDNFAPISAMADRPSQSRAGLIGPNHGFSVDVTKHLSAIPPEKRSAVPLKVWAVNLRRDGTVNLDDRVTIHDRTTSFVPAGGASAAPRTVKAGA